MPALININIINREALWKIKQILTIILNRGFYVDCASPNVLESARTRGKGSTPGEKAVSLFFAVRDGFRYEQCVNEECGRMEAALRTVAVENEPNQARIDWKCSLRLNFIAFVVYYEIDN
jgi:hypothetical protein